jgi:phage gp37-like protein
MPTQFKVNDVEQALITTLKANSALTALKAQIAALSSNQFDQQGNLIVRPPAVLVLYDQTSDVAGNDTTRKTYKTVHEFSIFCGAKNLSSVDNERGDCETLVATVRAALAGQRLAIDAGSTQTPPIELNGVAREQFDTNGVWYSARVLVEAIAQF